MGASGPARQICSAKHHAAAPGEAVSAWEGGGAHPLSTFLEGEKKGVRVSPQETHLGVQPCEVFPAWLVTI